MPDVGRIDARLGTTALVGLVACSGGDASTSSTASSTGSGSGAASSSVVAPSSSASAPPPTIYLPLPGGTSSAAIDARWPAEGFAAKKSRTPGVEVFQSAAVTVSIRREHCPSVESIRARTGVEVMSRGGGEATPDGNTPSWMVYRDGGKLGVIAVQSREGEGAPVCCLSGDETAASKARATLEPLGGKAAVEACLAALHAR